MGYVTNVPATVISAAEVIAKYHDLWLLEKSFRMSKTDLDALRGSHLQPVRIQARGDSTWPSC